MRHLVAGVCFCLVVFAGCNQTRKNCEHARDVYMAHAQKSMIGAAGSAPPEDYAELKKKFEAEFAHAKKTFVSHCEALDEEGRACIARIDELFQIDEAREKALDACPDDENGLRDETCARKAHDAANAKIGPCKDQLRALVDAVHEQAPRPPT